MKTAIAGILALAILAAPAYAYWGGSGFGYGYGMMGTGMMGYGYPGYSTFAWDKLTQDQKAVIQDKIRELQEKGAYPWEIRAEVYKLLKEYGL